MPHLSLRTAAAVVLAVACSSLPASGQAGAGGAGQLAAPNPQAYERVITAEAKTRAGMYTVHRVGQRLLFEIPRAAMNKDELLVMEIAKTVLGTGYGGQAVGNRVLRWERRDNRVYLRVISYAAVADSTRPEYQAVTAANVPPIVAVFNVEAYGRDSSAVIDVSRTFVSPPSELSPAGRIPGTIDLARSWIESATPFPDNVNVYSTLTFAQTAAGGGGRGAAPAPAGGRGAAAPNTNPSNTIVFSWSFHHLPEKAMMGRLCDSRVGYSSVTMTDYTDMGDKVRSRCYIARYRLEKKNPNAAVSDPVKPIVYYVDPATPVKWIPYVKAGIEEWQSAFREAGFSNAILAKEAPKEDPDWSPEDARYSIVRWLPSLTENASGPHVSDPRSGEIMEAHVQYYQNIERLQLGWYFIQASAVDARARKFPYPDSLMGRLLQQVVTHEVGHTLGFPHDMKGSSQYPTDSLRSASFLRQYGFSPSIMDYARYNYLVQPEDNVPLEWLLPRVGPYDRWATMWGYKPIPSARTPEDERATLDEWAREQDVKPWLRFATTDADGADPGEEAEAVGDMDPVKATGWGIKNIKREVAYLIPATVKPTEDYGDLEDLYRRLIGQWRTELGHVANLIGGSDTREKYGSQQGVRFVPLSKQRQQDAVRFLNENAFKTPSFFLDENITRRIAPSGDVARLHAAQATLLNSALQNARLLRLADYEAGSKNPGSTYSMQELLADLRHGIFSELAKGERIDAYRRTLQRAYVENLNVKLNPPPPAPGAGGGRGGGGGAAPVTPVLDAKLSDINAVVFADLRDLDADVRSAIPRSSDQMTRLHLEDMRRRIAAALKGKSGAGGAADEPGGDS